MKTHNTFSILFWLKLADANNGKAPLYARITVNGRRVEISLKRKIIINNWDTTKNRLKGSDSDTKLFNNNLQKVNNKLFECYEKLSLQNKLVSPQLVKAMFLGKGENSYKLSDIVEYHNQYMKETLRWGTQKNYYTTHKYVLLFLKKKHRTTDVYLSQLNYKFIIDFEHFLRQQKSMGNNTVMKHIERLRKLINLACKMEWVEKDPFIKFKAKFIKKERAFLTSEELQTIEKKYFDIPRLQLIKGLFVFSCYTGLSYGDVMKLTADNICLGIDGNKWIYSQREKTSIPVKIPLISKALDILEKYKLNISFEERETLFPTISNQKLNSYLKEIADVCGIKKNLTFHIARHTFATTVTLSNGVPIETVSKLLGHTKISTTQVYARVLEKKVSEDMLKLRDKYKRAKTQTKQTFSS